MSSTTEGAASAPPKRKRKPRSKPAKRYPSDLTDAQWPLIEPLLPPPATSGRAEEHPRREIVNVRGSKLARGRMFPGRGAIPLDQVLVANSMYADGSRLRRRLIAAGLKPAHCERCGLSAWRGEPMPLALDHVTATTATTGWRTWVSCARTATRSPRLGAAGVGRRSPMQRRNP